jgi:hypothetical protein
LVYSIIIFIGLDYPVDAQPNGIKLKPDKMIVEKLYHCIFEDKLFLFYKDEEELLHCYQVEDATVVKEISDNPTNIESILRRYAGREKQGT